MCLPPANGRIWPSSPLAFIHGGKIRQQIGPSSYNFLTLDWNITKLPHRIELNVPKNRIVFVFRLCYILAGK
jgi:hypothetical protein